MQMKKKIKLPKETFLVIDSHTMGEPTRIVINGFPQLQGNTMMERKSFVEKYYDHYRTALILEPRGHKGMFGAIINEPISEEADLGVIFMDSGGYLNMCGHGSIGSATVAVEAGLVPITEPYTEVVLEAPVGLIRTMVKVENNRATEVSLFNVPAFLYKADLLITLKDFGPITLDISFGGSFFALTNIEQFGIEILPENSSKITDIGMAILNKINGSIKVNHPYLDITTVDLVEFYGKATNPEADLKNVVIFGDAQVDRSPCGTGTSAKLAVLYAKGKIKKGQEFIYESITGSMFRGEVTEEVDIDGYKAIIPKITGKAYITGINTIIMDENDSLRYGFSI